MTLPTSGPLSLADIQGEFGGTNPIGLNEYYAGGGIVPAGTTGTYGAVPSSGTISIQNFYGTSNVVITLANQNISYSSGGLTGAAVGYQLSSGGQVLQREQTTYTNIGQWCTPTSQASNYEVLITVTSGSTPTGSPVGSWTSLSVSLEWGLSVGAGGFDTSTFTAQIRKTGTTTVLATATITLTADAIP
jgi:hypothetical protein